MSLFGYFRARLGGSRKEEIPGPPDLLSQQEFLRLVDREQRRADRTGDPVSVIAFTFPSGNGNDLRKLGGVLKKRVRATDEIGWLDSKVLGALLPGTPWEGANKVFEDVLSLVAGSLARPEVVIYVYPRESESPPLTPTNDSRKADGHPSLQSLTSRPMPRAKRLVDLAGATVGLALLSPVMLLVALAIKATSRGPILFCQQRRGRHGKPFTIYKFRTMIQGAEKHQETLRDSNEVDGPAFKMKRDPRVTWLGRFLRATSLDELPQLWNVFKGDMSLVGPRPLPCHEADSCASWQKRRLDVTPGLTGVWQVNGRSEVSFVEWMRMDLRYVQGQSVWLDLKLLLLTIPAVLLRKGAH